jgi:hypothetical protein
MDVKGMAMPEDTHLKLHHLSKTPRDTTLLIRNKVCPAFEII